MILVLCVIVGMILFMLPQVKKKPVIGVLVYLFGCAVIVKFFYSEGVFTVNYQDYWCMFEWAMLFIILSIILAVLAMTGISGGGADERFLGCLSLLVILIAPFGSNNYTFPILDCLFVPAPVTIWMLRRYWQPTREKLPHWSWHLMALFILVCTLFQGALFHLNFAFGDGTDGTKRTAVTGIPYLAVTALLWWNDTESYDKLCLMMFSGMTFCLILYMVLPNGLDIRPTAEAVGRDNIVLNFFNFFV